jgi:tRNA nucleotidyltransferase (CCA-adding enzyme)
LKKLEVNGNDLIKIGYKSGKELGKTLNLLLQMVIDGDCPNNKEILLQEAGNLRIERRM